MRPWTCTGIALICSFTPLSAQWSNRYPKVDGFSHHVYLEGYELPTLTAGPIDPAPAPDGLTVAFSSRGWIWLLDERTGTATRITAGSAMDFRPAWSPDGAQLAFVRDDGSDTWIVVLDLSSGEETIINTPAIDLDPAFSADGVFLYYASAAAGTVDIWQRNRATGLDTLLIEQPGTQLRPQPHPDGERVVFLGKRGSDAIRMWNMVAGRETVLQGERLTSMTRPVLSPSGAMVAYNWPTQERYELRLLSLQDPSTTVFLTASDGLPLTPAWHANERWIYFSEADSREVFHLKRIATVGGPVETVPVQVWHWGEPTGTLRVTTTTAARLSVSDASGHPAIPVGAQSRFDGQNGRVFFYSPGVVDITVPVGSVTVSAVRGLTTPEQTASVTVTAGGVTELALNLQSVWNPRDEGWISGDHHFHLNYGGQYRLTPDDIGPMMAGEELDVATPLVANLHNRFEDQWLWTVPSSGTTPIVRFGQEVRSHFLGHVGLLGINDLFWPWIWGPGYQVYGADDRPNTAALDHAAQQGGLSMYVHPFAAPNPLSPEGMRRVPVELVTDAVLGRFDLLELACLWSNELGTSALWYRFLNIGVPIAPSAGTDVMNNFYRTMAVGVTRVYVHTEGARDWTSYATALKGGRSFVTTGPLLDFKVAGAMPGDVVPAGRVAWELDVRSAVSFERIEILVNGEVVWSTDGFDHADSGSFGGRVELPQGGWIAARAHGGQPEWPSMNRYPFAHTAPIWIDHIGSIDGDVQRVAAAELLEILDVSEERLHDGYQGIEIPNLQARFSEARAMLLKMVEN